MYIYIYIYVYIYIDVEVFRNPARRSQLKNATVLQDGLLKLFTLKSMGPF